MSSILKPTSLLPQLGALTGPQWVELGVKYAPQLVTGLAVVGLAWQAARLTWLVMSPTVATNAPVAQPSTNVAPVMTINPQSIADAHLFGLAGMGNASDPNALPQSQAPLILAGTMALDDPEAGFAIIGESASNAKFYRVGSMMNGGVRLHAVYVDRVIIERNGALETLALPRGTPSNAPPPMARNVVVTNPVSENLRRLANNPNALGELIRAQPVFANGVQKGFRIYPGRDRQQFAKLGLQPGDLVTSVNGALLDDPNRAGEILNTLTASSSAQVSIERNGVTQQLTLDMAQVQVPDTVGDSSTSASGPVTGNGFSPPANRLPRNNRIGAGPNGTPDTSAQ